MYAGMAAVRTGQTSAYLQGNFGTSAPPRVANYLTRAFARPVLRPRVVRGAVIVLVFDLPTDPNPNPNPNPYPNRNPNRNPNPNPSPSPNPAQRTASIARRSGGAGPASPYV